ncbi:unnamed protein product [Tetraodon nigroviridis]|uniref:Chromosome 8 SCAF15044, whole genome shotgun sequence n=1 Tax=Tetraodon nigroviridis TaxID=99883 RepID=Q4RI18_TETNG|nr:unnamed protein product [Tetraodon nigroviridis]
MEVSRRRVLQKHLEPARPLRRCVNLVTEPTAHASTCAQALIEEGNPETGVDINRFYEILCQNKKKEGRLCYSRDVLISLANCKESRRKPEFLPEYSIVLTKARDAEHLRLHELWWNEVKEEIVEERPQ